MSDDRRAVTVERVRTGVYRATNATGDQLTFGSGDEAGFTPVELLLAAIGGCSAIDVDMVTSRRAEPDRFSVAVDATKVRDEEGSRLEDVQVRFDLRFPDDEDGRRAADRVPNAVRASQERDCTVSRTVVRATPVGFEILPTED